MPIRIEVPEYDVMGTTIIDKNQITLSQKQFEDLIDKVVLAVEFGDMGDLSKLTQELKITRIVHHSSEVNYD